MQGQEMKTKAEGNIKISFNKAKKMADEVMKEIINLKENLTPILRTEQPTLEDSAKDVDEPKIVAPLASDIEALCFCLRDCSNALYTIQDRIDL